MTFEALDTDWVAHIRKGGGDANGQPAERAISPGTATPCRHCLKNVPEGAEMLILAARPFPEIDAYAETGPIYLCADDCEKFEGDDMPPILTTSPDYLLKGYGADNRIVYGTGKITEAEEITGYCKDVFTDPNVTYIHVRSARNNCYQCKVTR